jgi:hypothetical protein
MHSDMNMEKGDLLKLLKIEGRWIEENDGEDEFN